MSFLKQALGASIIIVMAQTAKAGPSNFEIWLSMPATVCENNSCEIQTIFADNMDVPLERIDGTNVLVGRRFLVYEKPKALKYGVLVKVSRFERQQGNKTLISVEAIVGDHNGEPKTSYLGMIALAETDSLHTVFFKAPKTGGASYNIDPQIQVGPPR